MAQTANTGEDVAAYYRFRLGSTEMIVIADSFFGLPVGFMGGNQPEEDVRELLTSQIRLNADGTVPTSVINLVMLGEDGATLFDTGNGMQAGGKLVPTLDALGIGTDGVSAVVMSHFHPDHINGLSTDGTLTFPNAAVYYPQPEFDFMESAPGNTADAMAKLQPALDADRVTFYNPDDEVVPGVQAIATPGHTPGHMAFAIESDGTQLIHFVDSVINPYTHVINPTWSFGFDADPELAIESRQVVLDRAIADQSLVIGYHFPFPGIGYIFSTGDGTNRFAPAAY